MAVAPRYPPHCVLRFIELRHRTDRIARSRAHKPPARQCAGLAEAGEGFEEVGNAVGFGALEGLRQRRGVGGGGESGERGADREGLFGEGLGPRELRGGFGCGGRIRPLGPIHAIASERGLGRGGCRVLESGAQPADGAGAFFGGALGVERAEVGEDGFVAGGGRDGVGCGDGGVEVVVELAQEGDEAVFVGELFLGVERGAGAEFFEDVVEVGEGQLRVLGLLAFAVGVEFRGRPSRRAYDRSVLPTASTRFGGQAPRRFLNLILR
jgi:hypothetical protein